jgi:hypothetical protein
MTLKHPHVLPALSEFGIFYPIATAPPDLAPAHNKKTTYAWTYSYIVAKILYSDGIKNDRMLILYQDVHLG